MSQKKRIKADSLILSNRVTRMADRLGDILETDSHEAVRFSLFLATVTFAAEPEMTAKVRAEMRRLDAAERDQGDGD